MPGPGPGALVADRADLRRLLRPHPRTAPAHPVLSDVVVVLAGLIGVGGLFGAIAMWIKGLRDFMPPGGLGVFGCHPPGRRRLRPAGRAGRVVDVSAAAPPFMASDPRRRSPTGVLRDPLVGGVPSGPAAGDRPRADRAWRLATAPMPFRVVTKVKPLARGRLGPRSRRDSWGDTYVNTTDASGEPTGGRLPTRRSRRLGRPRRPDPRRLAAGSPPWRSSRSWPMGRRSSAWAGAGGLDPAAGRAIAAERRPGPLRDDGLADHLHRHR